MVDVVPVVQLRSRLKGDPCLQQFPIPPVHVVADEGEDHSLRTYVLTVGADSEIRSRRGAVDATSSLIENEIQPEHTAVELTGRVEIGHGHKRYLAVDRTGRHLFIQAADR